MDRPAVARAAMSLLPFALVLALWRWRRPAGREVVGMGLAFFWSFGTLALVNIGAIQLGFWQFHATGGLLATIPVDVLLGWGILSGVVPRLAFGDTSTWVTS